MELNRPITAFAAVATCISISREMHVRLQRRVSKRLAVTAQFFPLKHKSLVTQLNLIPLSGTPGLYWNMWANSHTDRFIGTELIWTFLSLSGA